MQIRDRLVAVLSDECFVVVLDEASWAAVQTPVRYRFGWTPPMRGKTTEGEPIDLVLLAPELIADVTAGLSDDFLDRYLTVVEAMLFTYVAQPALDHDTIEQDIIDRLYEAAPQALALFMDTDASAIDRGIVSPQP
jgi:hypothetical protein